MKSSFDKIANRICDCHVHFGQFQNDYYSSEEVVDWIEQLGINKVGIMPTGICGADEFDESKKIIKAISSEQIKPYLWLSPEMYDADPTMDAYNDINYKVIKIHPYIRREWYWHPEKIRGIIEVAYSKDVPVMFHTGGWKGACAIQFYRFCREYPDVTFILAHGRPLSQSITVLKGTKNAFVDSSFMDYEDIKIFCENGLQSRILFGTDFPIMKTFWPSISLIDWYKENINRQIDLFGEKQFMVWSYENFHKLIM